VRRLCLLVPLLLLFSLTAAAEAPKVTVVATKIEPATAHAGEVVLLTVKFAIDDGWHLYGALNKAEGSLPTVLGIKKGLLTAVGKQTLPPGTKVKKWEIVYHWLEGEFEMTQQLRVPDGTKPSDITLDATLTYQPCTEEICLDTQVIPLSATLKIIAGEAEPGKTEVKKPAAAEKSTKKGLDEDAIPSDLWQLITLAFLAGLLALVMPCTYPMIPITISFFTKQAEARGGKVLPLSLTYGIGIVSMFILIGLLVGPVIVRFAAHPATNIVVGLLFLVFALALFGVFTLNPPSWMLNFAGQASSKGGFGGVFMMGATLVLTSFTCTAPFVGSLLSASSGAGTLGIVVGMGVFGLTMAIPFVFLSLAPGKMAQMPKSGEWMHVIKVSLGFLEIAAALKFFSNADMVWELHFLSRDLFLLLWAGIFGASAAYLFGWIRLAGERNEGVGPLRMTIGLLVLLFATYCWYGAQGNKLDPVMVAIVPNYQARTPKTKHEIFVDNWDAAVARARTTGKQLFVNFTGHT